MLEILKKKLARLIEKRSKLKAAGDAATEVKDVDAVRAQIEEVDAEISETRSMIEAIETEQRNAQQAPKHAELVNGNIVGSFRQNTQDAEQRDLAPTATKEYRNAFKRYVQSGAITEVRAGEVITVTDSGAAVPVTVMNEVINIVRKRYGNLYNRVRKLNVQGGVAFPVGSLVARFKWVSESTVSPRQKLGPLGKVTFAYHTAEIRIAQSFLSSIVTLDAFEAEIARCIAIAYMQAMDESIVRGSGDGMPLGIINDPRVTNVVEMTEADMSNWTAWRKKFFAKLPLGYRAGEFIFTMSTVETYLETMTDSNNNPVFWQATGLEVNDGDAADPNGRFFGRSVSLVEPDILPDFTDAADGDVIGIFWQPEWYAINEQFGFTMLRYFDQETNEWVDKALVVCDGKTLNPAGFVLIKKKAS